MSTIKRITLPHLLLLETVYHRVNFLLGMCIIATICAGAGTGAMLLRFDHHEALRLGNEKKAALEKAMRTMCGEYRTITNRMGPVMRLVPASGSGDDFYTDAYDRTSIDASILDSLKNRFCNDLHCAVPLVKKRIVWGPAGRKVLCRGIGTELTVNKNGFIPPHVAAPPAGTVRLGYELHTAQGLRPGEAVSVHGHRFLVDDTAAQSGSIDDITITMSAADARILGMGGRGYQEILLWPRIDTADAAAFTLAERLSSLPGCRTVVAGPEALLQVHARMTAAATEREALEREQAGERRHYHGLLLRLTLLSAVLFAAASTWAIVLSVQNLLDRRGELAALYAIGIGGGRLTTLVTFRAAAMGITGSAAGSILAAAVILPLHPEIYTLQFSLLAAAAGAGLMIIAALGTIGPVRDFIVRTPVFALTFEGGES